MDSFAKNKSAAYFAVCSAAFLIPALVAVYIPLLSIFSVFLMPLPLAALIRRMDLRYGLAVLFITGMALYLLTGNMQPVLFLSAQTGLLGILLGLLFKNNVPTGKSIAVAVGFSLFIAAVLLSAVYLQTGASPFALNMSDRAMFEQLNRDLIAMGGAGVGNDPEKARELESVITQVKSLWPVFAATSTIIWFMVSAFVSYLITRFTIARLGYSVPPPVPFARWRFPWYIIWGIISGLALILAGDRYYHAGLIRTGNVLLWVTGFLLLLQGLSVAVFCFRRWIVPWPIRLSIVLVLIVLAHITVMVLVTLGLVDSIWDIRRLSTDGRLPEEEDKK